MIPHTSVPWDGDIFTATFSLWFLVLYFPGGLENKGQEVALRKNPDIIVATPGRLVDHLRNTPSFSLQNIEILVLDEADRCVWVWGESCVYDVCVGVGGSCVYDVCVCGGGAVCMTCVCV